MTGALPFGGASVMQRRVEPPSSLDFFPTPPWATRALIHHVLRRKGLLLDETVWEPAAGEGHMAEVLREFFAGVVATDVFDYGRGYRVVDFLSDATPGGTDWIITNPPFKVAAEFVLRALAEAKVGVAVLVRTSWLEGGDRYRRIFQPNPPAIIGQFCERVPMTKGRWDPEASTATSYSWVVWTKGGTLLPSGDTVLTWIPPGQRTALTKPDDAARFGMKPKAGLLEAGA